MATIKDILAGNNPAIPVWETLDLITDGSEVPTIVYTQLDYTFIERVIWLLYFEDSAIDWEDFAGDTALSIGINLVYNGTNLTSTHPIKSNEDFHVWGYDVSVQSDDKIPKGNIITARWTFSKSIPHGLGMWDGETFGVLVSEDITALTTVDEFHLSVQGWRLPD